MDEAERRGPVVSNTSPLISLAAVGYLDLLHELYGEIVVPATVLGEYEAGRQAHEPVLEDLDWIRVVLSPPDAALPENLDPGEAAAIAMARALDARVVLLDEQLGRRVANELELPVVGTLATLLRAKAAGRLRMVEPVLDAMIERGMWVSNRLRAEILIAAGEDT